MKKKRNIEISVNNIGRIEQSRIYSNRMKLKEKPLYDLFDERFDLLGLWSISGMNKSL